MEYASYITNLKNWHIWIKNPSLSLFKIHMRICKKCNQGYEPQSLDPETWHIVPSNLYDKCSKSSY